MVVVVVHFVSGRFAVNIHIYVQANMCVCVARYKYQRHNAEHLFFFLRRLEVIVLWIDLCVFAFFCILPSWRELAMITLESPLQAAKYNTFVWTWNGDDEHDSLGVVFTLSFFVFSLNLWDVCMIHTILFILKCVHPKKTLGAFPVAIMPSVVVIQPDASAHSHTHANVPLYDGGAATAQSNHTMMTVWCALCAPD